MHSCRNTYSRCNNKSIALQIVNKVHKFLPTSLMSKAEADDVLDTYMTSYILGEDLSTMTLQSAIELKAEMPEVYMAWNETQQFVRDTLQHVTESDASAEQKASAELDFSLVARTAERIGERFGHFQDGECQQIKASLVKMEQPGTGRVRLSDFYKPAMGGQWQFQESVSYLRQLGCLDESDPAKPSVIIANYVSSPSNCIASSSFYSVCCMDECEGLLSHLEQKIAAPDATSTQIVTLVSDLSSSSVVAPRKLSTSLLDRLGEIAAGHGGSVPLHGRLFAQWMHHAFPRECPYPHVSGTTNPQTPDEWLEATGEETTATTEEMSVHVDTVHPPEQEVAPLPWHPEEELLVAGKGFAGAGDKSTFASMRSAVLMMIVASMAYGAVSHSSLAPAGKGGFGGEKAEKFMV